MKQDIKTLSNNVTELVNNFIFTATSRARAEGKPVYVSLMEAAPPDMSAYDIDKHIPFILEELSSRPELKEITFPRTREETEMAEQAGPMSLVVSCNPAYCKNIFDYGLEAEQGYMEPKRQLSIARKSEIADNAITYVQEESLDAMQDLTERLGFSMEELNALNLSFPTFDPLRLDFVVETNDPVTEQEQFASYKTIDQALTAWKEDQGVRIYAETEFGALCLVHSRDDLGQFTCLPLTTSLHEAGLLFEDLPEKLVENLETALDYLSIHFPKEVGLPSKLTLENAIGQTVYYSEHCFYGEILNMEPVLCTGFKPGEEEYLDQVRIQREVEDTRGNLHELKHVLLRSQILLNREDVLSEALAAWNWKKQKNKSSMLAVSKNVQTGHIFMIPLDREEDPFDGTSKLRRWTQEYCIDSRAPEAGESLSKDGYDVFFFDISDIEGAVDKTIELMRLYVSEIQQNRGNSHLGDLLSACMEQARVSANQFDVLENHPKITSEVFERG